MRENCVNNSFHLILQNSHETCKIWHTADKMSVESKEKHQQNVTKRKFIKVHKKL